MILTHAQIVRHVHYASLYSHTICARKVRRFGVKPVVRILWRESNWNTECKTGSHYGLGQFAKQTWKDVKVPKTSNPKAQIQAVFLYIDMRYKGNPDSALAHQRRFGWY